VRARRCGACSLCTLRGELIHRIRLVIGVCGDGVWSLITLAATNVALIRVVGGRRARRL